MKSAVIIIQFTNYNLQQKCSWTNNEIKKFKPILTYDATLPILRFVCWWKMITLKMCLYVNKYNQEMILTENIFLTTYSL